MTIHSVVATEQTLDSASWTHDAPSGLTEGDVVVMVVRLDTTADELTSISSRAEDTTWVERANEGTYKRTYVYTQTIGNGGTPPTTYDLTFSGTASGNTFVYRLSGVAESSYVIGTVNSGTSVSPSPGAFSFPASGSADLINYTAYTGGVSLGVTAYPAGYPDNQEDTGPENRSAATGTVDSAGSAPAADTFTLSFSTDWKCFLIGFEDAPTDDILTGFDITSQPVASSAGNTLQGRCPKHMKGCCPQGCKICDDYFNRANENPVTGKWVTVDGEWRVQDLQLQMVSEGPIISTCIPPPRQDAEYYSYIMEFKLKGTGNGPWKIICKYEDVDNFDWVLLHYRTIGGSSGLVPIFYRRSGGADSVMFDPETDYPDHVFLIITPENNGGVTPITICYGEQQWTLGSQGSAEYDAECGDPTPADEFPVGAGLVGFLAGPTDGTFDDFYFTVLWETDHDCPNCSCICYASDDDYQCLPPTLYLTLDPYTSADPNCLSSGLLLEWELYQSVPISPNPDAPVSGPAVTFDAYPEKRFWFSLPFFHGGATNPCPDWPYPFSNEGTVVWWRFECIAVGEYELALLDYPTGALSEPEAAPRTIAQFVTQDGDALGSIGTAVTCGITTAEIRINFGDFKRFLQEIGSGGGVFNCCPFSDELYEVWIDDTP